MTYTHLQLRSGYSLMSSTITIEKLVKRAWELDYDALALTDDHVLYGAITFYQTCQKYGIKPILGMVTWVEEEQGVPASCVLLAKNNAGYRNLIRLSTYLQQNQMKTIAFNDLAPYVSHVVGILPANNSVLASLLVEKPFTKVDAYVQRWMRVFGEDDFYLGIQDHGLAEERKIQTPLKAFHETYKISVVAINDVRYLYEKDVIAYDCLLAMRDGKRWNPNKLNPALKHRHLRSVSEMEDLFGSFWPEVLTTTETIKNKCNVQFNFHKQMLPSFPVPEATGAHDFLEKLCWKYAREKYEIITEQIEARLMYELRVIKSMGFSDYFLIVWDFIQYAKEQNIAVGPGRGSAAGSLVAYVLGITEVDPLEYDLLFERFLNPERLNMPDIDVDFSDAKRDEVIAYVRNKYGHERVAQIITFGTFAARSLIRELIKTIGVDQHDSRFILQAIPVQSKKRIVELVQESEDLKEYIKQSQTLKILFTVASVLEGLPRHISTHAAGVVISKDPLLEHVPLTVGHHGTNLTQYDMDDLESIGLLKMDFLGLRNLTLLENIVRTIGLVTRTQLDLQHIPNDDPQTYALLQKGMTNGVFQLESQGMKRVLKKLQPESFEDIVVVNALFRPGPMEFIQTYINRRHGREKVTYPHPDLAPILDKTYGVLIYQEQIMLIANKMAGFSLGQADILRRAISKKEHHLMAEQREKFIKGCLNNGYDQRVAEEIFAWVVKFSNYGFNRSHAVAYSKISYQFAYLKTHYPACFFAEMLSSIGNQQEKLHQYINEIQAFDLRILPPSINKSFGKYAVESGHIRMGLLAIKGIGGQAVKAILQARKDGPFKSLFDFCLRTSPQAVNRKTLEHLIMAGAFDELHSNRASLLASIDQAIEQGELFHEFHNEPNLFTEKIELQENYVDIEDFSQAKKLTDEKMLLGIYVSSHPLKEHRRRLRASGFITLKRARQFVGMSRVKSAAIVQAIKSIRTRRGDPMAFLTLADETGEMEAVVFPDLYRRVSQWLQEETIVQVNGKIEERNERIQWLLADISPFNAERLTPANERCLYIKWSKQKGNISALQVIKQAAARYPGATPVIVHDANTKKTYKLAEEYFVNPTPACLKGLKRYFGEASVVLE